MFHPLGIQAPVRHLVLAAFATALLLGSSPGAAQNPAPLANPNLDLWSGGTVYAIARRPDGSTIVGGEFTSVFSPGIGLSIDRRNLAKFDAAGNLDLGWDPSPSYKVTALAVDGAGAVYVGGNFDQIAGQARSGVVKLDGSTGAIAANWTSATNVSPCDPFNLCVLALALAPGDSALHVGGEFSAAGGATRYGIAKLSTSTGLADPAWNPDSRDFFQEPGAVFAIRVDAGGNLFVGGFFETIGGQTRTGLAKLLASGTADATWNPAPGNTVRALALDGAGFVYAGGEFTSIGGQARSRLAKLSTTGSGAADATWNPAPVASFNAVTSLQLDGQGALYVGGGFTTIGGQPLRNLARVATTGAGAPDLAWTPGIDRQVNALLAVGNGDLDVAGSMTRAGALQTLGLARVGTNGALVRAGYVQGTAAVYALARATGGGTWVGGLFERANGLERGNVLKLAADGTLDPTWNPIVSGTPAFGFNGVRALVDDGAGSLYLGGGFEAVGGTARRNLAKVSTSGTGAVDGAWNPSPSNSVEALARAADGSLYVGGFFSSIGGQSFRSLARVQGGGTGLADATWNPNPFNGGDVATTISAIVPGPGGEVYVGGAFTSLNGQFASRVSRLDPVTGLPLAGWNASVGGCTSNLCVSALALDGSGLLVGGYFSTVGGQARPRLARVSATTGELDAGFDAQVDATTGLAVRGLAMDAGGGLYVGGSYLLLAGQVRANVARVSGTTGVLDANWNPGTSGSLFPVLLSSPANGPLVVGGFLNTVAGEARRKLAAIPSVAIGDTVYADGFE